MAIPQCQHIEQGGYAPVWNDDNMKQSKDFNIILPEMGIPQYKVVYPNRQLSRETVP